MVDLELFKQAVMDSRDGITIANARDPDLPLVFVNPAFERMTGYSRDEAIGRNCRFLEAMAGDETAGERLRTSLATGRGCTVTLHNMRRNGSDFWTELSLSPVHDEQGAVTHFIAIHKDVSHRVFADRRLRAQNDDLENANHSLERLITLDALTGVYNRRHFDDRLDVLWSVAMRNADSLALFFMDIDHFKRYNDRFGHLAGDKALISVAETLADSFQRGSDFLARYGGEEFVLLASGTQRESAARFAQSLCERVRSLALNNPDAPARRLTISVGFAVITPQPGMLHSDIIETADRALFAAKAQGRDRAVGSYDTA